ncbi:MAG: hypothetical protein ACYS18_07675 [Planctomycetota bacterium]|jgi:hypothetical protein
MRYYYNRKATADESCRLEMSYLKKRGMLTGEESIEKITWTSSMTGKTTAVLVLVDVTDEPFVILSYTVTDREGNKTDYDYEVSLVTTPCNFGGVRYWFACLSCGRRVAVLYLAPGDVYFRCRHCNNLSYNSRNRCSIESFGHISRQADKLRSQIKRWTWRGRPTRKVRRLRALERKTQMLGGYAMARIDRLNARISRHR